MRREASFLSLIILCALAGRAAAATTVTRFVGVVDTVFRNDSQMLGMLSPGDPISGHFTFSDDPAASFGNDRFAAEVGLTLPAHVITVVSNNNYIRAENNVPNFELGVVDEFHHAYDAAGPVAPSGPFVVHALTVRFIDADATMFDGTDPFPVAIDMNHIEQAEWWISGGSVANPSQQFSIRGTVTALVVPEPQVLGLGALCVAAAACGRRW